MKLQQVLSVLLFTSVIAQQKESSTINLGKPPKSGEIRECYKPMAPANYTTLLEFSDTCQPEGDGGYPSNKTTCACKRCDLTLELSCIDHEWYSENPIICNNPRVEKCGTCTKVRNASDVTCDSGRKGGYLREQRQCTCINTQQQVTLRCTVVGWKVTDYQAYREACGDPADYTTEAVIPDEISTVQTSLEEAITTVQPEVSSQQLQDEMTSPADPEVSSTTVLPETARTEENEGMTEEATESYPETTIMVTERDEEVMEVSLVKIGTEINTETSLPEAGGKATRCYQPLVPDSLLSKLDTCTPKSGEFPSHEATCHCDGSDLVLEIQCMDFEWLYDHANAICE